MPKNTLMSNCTVQTWDGGTCNAPGHKGLPFPICAAHAAALWRRVNEQMGILAGDEHAAKDGVPLTLKARERVARKVNSDGSSKSVVYYLRVGDLIKIGTTVDLRRRLDDYPPNHVVLALERGGTGLETYRLKQFAHLLAAKREWFTPGEDLIRHINGLRSQIGKKPVTA